MRILLYYVMYENLNLVKKAYFTETLVFYFNSPQSNPYVNTIKNTLVKYIVLAMYECWDDNTIILYTQQHIKLPF